MTEEIPATPGWVDQQLQQVFAGLPAETKPARDAYARCLARNKPPGAPTDLLGAEFESCHVPLRRALIDAGVDAATMERLQLDLEALEAEITQDS